MEECIAREVACSILNHHWVAFRLQGVWCERCGIRSSMNFGQHIEAFAVTKDIRWVMHKRTKTLAEIKELRQPSLPQRA